jgi:DNA repair exonuclease SbcCD ATPase subunit
MPKGITQDQVNAAADALIGSGENPTVEKVRAALGTGSPNTVTRMLEVWRVRIGQRLQQMSVLPELPSPVGQAMRDLWSLAVEHAQALALAQQAEERATLATDRQAVAEERVRWAATLEEAVAAVAQAQAKQQLMEHACANLDDQLQDSHALRADLVQQRDRLQVRCDGALAEVARLHGELQHRDASLTEERQRHDAHVRAVEDRAHAEVDRARQEAKAIQQQLGALQHDHMQAVSAWERERNALQRTMRDLEQRAAHAAGRAAALEARLVRAPSTRKPAKASPPSRKAASSAAPKRSLAKRRAGSKSSG